jgi:hypothetical protein
MLRERDGEDTTTLASPSDAFEPGASSTNDVRFLENILFEISSFIGQRALVVLAELYEHALPVLLVKDTEEG